MNQIGLLEDLERHRKGGKWRMVPFHKVTIEELEEAKDWK